MNVFILSTGRCGSTTIMKACQHITNFTSAHESRCHLLGEERLSYPENHIESDNRLAWFLGRLDKRYGDDAIYVHLKRDRGATARSYAKRLFVGGIIPSYRISILQKLPNHTSHLDVALDYCDTVNENIEVFLKDKTKKMVFNIETAEQDFRKLWHLCGAEGDLQAALAEFRTLHNASGPKPVALAIRLMEKAQRIFIRLPDFIRYT